MYVGHKLLSKMNNSSQSILFMEVHGNANYAFFLLILDLVKNHNGSLVISKMEEKYKDIFIKDGRIAIRCAALLLHGTFLTSPKISIGVAKYLLYQLYNLWTNIILKVCANE